MLQQGILVLAEHDGKMLKSSTHKTLGAAKYLPGEVTLLIVGNPSDLVIKAAGTLCEVSKIWILDLPEFQEGLAENISAVMAELGKSFSFILAPATTYGKNIAPRVAALLDVSQISDVVKILSEDTFVRPIYAGNVLATVQSVDPIRVLTVRSTAFEPVAQTATKIPVEKITNTVNLGLSRLITRQSEKREQVELESARVVISGGRGLRNQEGFEWLKKIANQLGAALGASRAAVDAGFVENDCQVGQTGKIVAPDLYIAVGISGAIQHVAGIKDSKIIVAINQDPEAPIFQVADYGLVGDLFSVLPELHHELAIQMDKI